MVDSPRFPYGETVTLVSQALTGVDGDGNDVYAPSEVAVPYSVFAPAGSVESLQGRDTVTTNPTIYLADGAPVPKATDRVRRANGDVYEIDGDPEVYPPNPFTGWVVGPVLRLRKVTG